MAVQIIVSTTDDPWHFKGRDGPCELVPELPELLEQFKQWKSLVEAGQPFHGKVKRSSEAARKPIGQDGSEKASRAGVFADNRLWHAHICPNADDHLAAGYPLIETAGGPCPCTSDFLVHYQELSQGEIKVWAFSTHGVWERVAEKLSDMLDVSRSTCINSGNVFPGQRGGSCCGNPANCQVQFEVEKREIASVNVEASADVVRLGDAIRRHGNDKA